VTEWYPGEQEKRRPKSGWTNVYISICVCGVCNFLFGWGEHLPGCGPRSDRSSSPTPLCNEIVNWISGDQSKDMSELIRVTLRHHFSGIISHQRRAALMGAGNLKIN
jgi:hypothetical protein